jgi:hypothetical protein
MTAESKLVLNDDVDGNYDGNEDGDDDFFLASYSY